MGGVSIRRWHLFDVRLLEKVGCIFRHQFKDPSKFAYLGVISSDVLNISSIYASEEKPLCGQNVPRFLYIWWSNVFDCEDFSTCFFDHPTAPPPQELLSLGNCPLTSVIADLSRAETLDFFFIRRIFWIPIIWFRGKNETCKGSFWIFCPLWAAFQPKESVSLGIGRGIQGWTTHHQELGAKCPWK